MAPKTVIVGAGIVGVATALWLQRQAGRRDIVLIDREGPAGGTSFGNAGLLVPSGVVPVVAPGLWRKAPAMLLDGPLFMKWRYLPRLLPWLCRYMAHGKPDRIRHIARNLHPVVGDSLADHQALAAGTPAARWIRPCDYLFAYSGQAAYAADSLGWTIRKELGMRWDVLTGRAAAALEPRLAPAAAGLLVRLGEHGLITDPGRYIRDLAAAFAAAGGRVRQAAVTDIVTANGAVTGVRLAGGPSGGAETLACDRLVLATGAWSRPLLRQAGLTVPLESERGYHLEFWEPNIMPERPVMLAAGKFLLSPMDGRLRCAGLVEFGGLAAPASRAPYRFLENRARRMLPGLTWKRRSEWMGHRPVLSDSLPVIGPVPGIRGAFTGFGHHHVGLTAGALTGRLLAQLVSGINPNIDLEPYAPGRFGEGRQKNKNPEEDRR